MADLIDRQAAIKAARDWYEGLICGSFKGLEKRLRALPSAQPERLTDDDFETIRIHLNAYKEKLCNQQRWKEAEEYQRIIDRFMAFASAQPDLDEWCTDCKEYDQEKHCCPRFNRVIRETVEEVRKNAEQRWIPVEDEPPKFGKDVLISHKGAVSIDWLTQSEGSAYFFMSGAGIADIDAWQPLPNPYEGGEDENV